MKLSHLLDAVDPKVVRCFQDHEITGIAYDPMRVEPGYLFAAIDIYTQLNKVEILDGHTKIRAALDRGATALLLKHEPDFATQVPVILTPTPRKALAQTACAFYQHPSRRLRMFAVTGTNGKTTVTHLVESIFQLEAPTGIIGTLYARWPGTTLPSKDTTPEPPDLQEILGQMADQGVRQCALEATSHGVEFFRMEGIVFQVGAFTNLTPDHLDFHGTLDNYRAAKMKIFQGLPTSGTAVLNIDDPAAPLFAQVTQARILNVGFNPIADICATDLHASIHGTRFQLRTPSGQVHIESPLIGRHNIANAMVAAGIAYAEGLELTTIQAGLCRPIPIPGRFEQVPNPHPFSVVVDYAHTPDAFQNVLTLAQELEPNRILTLFGCGGDRDRTKRPEMARIAEQFSDHVIVTADNPRNESPTQIFSDIRTGFQGDAFEVIEDRGTAIQAAILQAEPGDLVLILGKGHEQTQTIGDRAIPFSDRDAAIAALHARG